MNPREEEEEEPMEETVQSSPENTPTKCSAPSPSTTTTKTPSTSEVPRRLLFGDPPEKVEIQEFKMLDRTIKGFKRGDVAYFPFGKTMEAFGLHKKADLLALGRKRDRLQMPVYNTVPKEIQALKAAGVVTPGTTRTNILDEKNTKQFLETTLKEFRLWKEEEEGEEEEQRGNTKTGARPFIIIDDDDDDGSSCSTPKNKGGRTKTVHKQLFPQELQDNIKALHQFYRAELNSKRDGSPLSLETARKTDVNITCEC